VQGDAEKLPFADGSMDLFTIAFGIRNVTHVDRAIAEAYRVLKPGGRFMCLEFSRVTNPLLQQAYDAYSFAVIPALGAAVANDRASYQYLVESIRKFPDQDTFAGMIEDAGFRHVRYRNMTFGIAAVHSGFKL
jgi:ubiquinone/menaquinone biosynthesis methyltransferase